MTNESPPAWLVRELPVIGLAHLVGAGWVRLTRHELTREVVSYACAHGATLAIDATLFDLPVVLPSFAIVDLRSYRWMTPEQTLLPIWIGECPECGRAFWAGAVEGLQVSELAIRAEGSRSINGARRYKQTFQVVR